MTEMVQLKADLTAVVLAKCLQQISNCYVKLAVKGNLSITIDSDTEHEVEIDAVCFKSMAHSADLQNDEEPVTVSDYESCDTGNVSTYDNSFVNTSEMNKTQTESRVAEYRNELNATSSYSEVMSNDEDSSRAVLDIQPLCNQETNELASKEELKCQIESQHEHKGCKLEVQETLDIVTTEKIEEIKQPKSVHPRSKVALRQYSNEALLEAMRKVYEDKMSISQAAKQCGIPVRTLNDKVRGKTPIFSDPYKRRTFSKEVEQELVYQLKDIAEKTNGLTYKKIREYLTVAQEKYPKQRKIPFSSAYITKFLHRWPELQKFCGYFAMNSRKKEPLLPPSIVKEQLQDFLSHSN